LDGLFYFYMGGKGRNREQQNYWNQQAQTQNQAIATVDPLEQKWRDKQMAFLKWDETPGKDVRDAPGMSDHIQIGQGAIARAKQEKYGTGALQLGGAGNAGYTENLKTLRQNEMGQEVGAGLEEALAGRRAEATGSIMPLSQLSTSRRLGQAQHSAGMFGQWNQRQSKNWWDYLREGVQVAGQVGGMVAGV
jgi:hypothetical protein